MRRGGGRGEGRREGVRREGGRGWRGEDTQTSTHGCKLVVAVALSLVRGEP